MSVGRRDRSRALARPTLAGVKPAVVAIVCFAAWRLGTRVIRNRAFALIAIVWGVLALGTASLGTGMLPRAAVILWMVAIPAEVTVNWLPATLVGLAGIAWCSIVLLRARRPEPRPRDRVPRWRARHPTAWFLWTRCAAPSWR